MRKLLFLGPTLSVAELRLLDIDVPIVHVQNFDFSGTHQAAANALLVCPPAAGGDLIRLPDLREPFCLAIIDGYFENCASVWHKEILYFLAQGIPVFGAASMGALRAAELASFGMQGIGRIYHDFAAGRLEDDDEVTVSHGPAALGYPCLSDAMVNIRYTTQAAEDQGIISPEDRDELIRVAKATFYKQRQYSALIGACSQLGSVAEAQLVAFADWLETEKIDQKKQDAIALIRQLVDAPIVRTAGLPKFDFEDTFIWRHGLSEPG